jgi:hypothetical protein
MQCIDTIKRILSEPIASSGLLVQELIVTSPPASMEQLQLLEGKLPRQLSVFHRELLLNWNGLDLDVVRFFGSGDPHGVATLLDSQSIIHQMHAHWIVIGSDSAGFLYAEDDCGAIWSIDHDGGATQCVANSLDEFISDYIFGKRAADFGGESWYDDLVAYGVVSRTNG